MRLVFDAPGVDDSAPNWSPDGSLIAFESDMDGDGEIYVIHPDGTGLRQLTDNAVHDEGPSWSPDGRRIVFTSGSGNLEGEIYVMNADGSGRTRITDSPGRDESPDWQPLRFAGDLAPCGDAATSGPGAYSVHAAGIGCAQARRLAALWGDEPDLGLRCERTPAGPDAELVECRHAGRRDEQTGNDKALAWLLRLG